MYTFAEQLSQGLRGQTIAAVQLQADTLSFIALMEMVAHDACQHRGIANTEVIEAPHDLRFESDRPVYGIWAERCSVDRCGTLVAYRVDYTYNAARGGTEFAVRHE